MSSDRVAGTQLDNLTAACKLVLAGAVHGVEAVTSYAVEFARYGRIEVRRFFLLQGPSVTKAIPLDDYCTLIPYSVALERLASISSERSSEEDLHWPTDNADNVCVLDTRSYERERPSAGGFELNTSPLLQSGAESLTLILGLVWGRGYRVFGNWHGVAEPVEATLPFIHTTGGRGWGGGQAALLRRGFRRPSLERPLNTSELADLVAKWPNLDSPNTAAVASRLAAAP